MVLAAAMGLPWVAFGQQAEISPAPRPLLPGPPPVPPPLPPSAAPPREPLERWLDPGPDGWGPYGPASPAPSFFFSTELDVIHPVVRNRLTNDTPLQPSGDVLTVPEARLPWTVSPWFDLGYWLPDSLGLVSLNYRFIMAEGSGTDRLLGEPAELRSRLTQHVINIDYGTTPCSFAPHWNFAWRFGVEIADVFFDSRLQEAALFQQASNNFFGAGPHARLELEHAPDLVPGLSLFSRVEGAVDFGRIDQHFREGVPRAGELVGGLWDQNGLQTVPTLLLEAGLSYRPPLLPCTIFSLGYFYEHWWYVGQLGTDSNAGLQSATRGEVESMGFFLRGQVNY